MLSIDRLYGSIPIGITGENEFRNIKIDVSSWISTYPTATITAVYKRPDGEIYPVNINITDNILTWSPTSTDLAVSGDGSLEFRLEDNGVIGKSAKLTTRVKSSLGDAGGVPPAPEPDWLTEGKAYVDDAVETAKSLTAKMPVVGENGNWWTWNATTEQYEDSGEAAQGPQGIRGIQGEPGPKGDPSTVNNIVAVDGNIELTANDIPYDEDTSVKVKIDELRQQTNTLDANKVDNSRVLTDVPVNAKFTDTTYAEITTAEIDAGAASTLRTITGRRIKYILDKVQGWIGNLTKADVGLDSVDNVKQATKVEFDAHKADGTQHAKTARFVIGTSTAGWTAADCDYLCDGTADQVEINAAITALPATGGEIVILDGTYNITARIDVNKSNVSITGNGNATILERLWGSSEGEGVIHLFDVENCSISDLRINGNMGIYTSTTSHGVHLNCSRYCSIKNTTFTQTHRGITLYDNVNYPDLLCTNNIIANNIIYESGRGIQIWSYTGGNLLENTITGNTCNNNDYGMYIRTSSNNTITGNTCNNNSDYGILISSSNSNTITGNTCNDNNSYGIRLGTSNDNTVTGNTCNNNNDGISIYNSSNDNNITGNTCNDNNSSGIYLDTSNNNTITGNTCNNNNWYGIQSYTSSNNNITGNTCNDNNSSGIRLGTSNNNNTVTGNTCIRGAGLATDYTASQHTIQLSGTSNSYNLIAMNNCMGKAVTNGGGTGNTLVNNKFDAT